MKKKNLFVFDIDDTLTKSEEQHINAYLDAMHFIGVNNVNTDWKSYKNVTDSFILKENYEANFNKDFNFSIIEEFENEMTSSILQMPKTSEIKGAAKVVDFLLKETDYAVCFATGSLLKPAYIKLEQADINFIPDVVEASNAIFTREDIVKSAIDKAKNYFQVSEFEHIISVGDGLWDVTTARNLGVHFLGMNDKNKTDFQKEKVKYYLKDWTTFNLKEVEQKLQIK